MGDTEYNVQEKVDKLYSDLVCKIGPCLSVFDSDGKREAKECVLWVHLSGLGLTIDSKENTPEVWKEVKKWKIKDVIGNLKKIKRKARKMPFVQERIKEMIGDIKKKRRNPRWEKLLKK